MKAQKSILMAILLGIVFSLSGKANESEATKEAVYDLRNQISYVFKNLPWEDVVDDENCCVLLTFRVNEQQIVEIVGIEGKNEDLVHYAKVVLNNQEIKTGEALSGRKYSMEIRFENKG